MLHSLVFQGEEGEMPISYPVRHSLLGELDETLGPMS